MRPVHAFGDRDGYATMRLTRAQYDALSEIARVHETPQVEVTPPPRRVYARYFIGRRYVVEQINQRGKRTLVNGG